jgi:type IV pilus assembly protein PilY1
MRKNLLRTLAALALLAVLSFPHDSLSVACVDPAPARTFYAGALADAILNPPTGEDNQFFTSSGGIPNIFFLMDTGASMGRLPPNGPISLGLPTAGAPGCGTDPTLGGLDANAATMIALLGARTYHSPCGTVAATIETMPYQPGVDYYAAPEPCPYYTQGSNAFVTPSTGGYDPDWPAFFPETATTVTAQVFHTYGSETDPNYDCQAQPTGKGWDFAGTYPYSTVHGNKCQAAVVSDFCADTARVPAASQNACLKCLYTQGWYYDGTNITGTYDGVANVTYPSMWYTGNYLSFFPPKFLVARKLVKDTIGYQARVRMAMGGMMPGWGFQQAPNPAGDLGPNCQLSQKDSGWTASRSTVVKSADNLTWGGMPNLSEAVFDIGHYYRTPNGNASAPWFGPTWESSSTWQSMVLSASSSNQRAVCWSCQVSTVILLSDGVTSATDGTNLPPGTCSLADSNSGTMAGAHGTGILGCSTADCPQCADPTFATSVDYRNNLARVSFYMHNYDLRDDPAGNCSGSNGSDDGRGMPGKQVLDIYTVGFAAGKNTDGSRALNNAAKAGGGTFIAAEAADDLKAGLVATFNEINTRATSFSVATVSTLQTTTGHSVVVPRFVPARAPDWQGHLSRYELYSEFVNACTPNGPGDLDCDGSCASVFLTDKNGNFVSEDGNGNFVLTTDGNPPCSQTPLCGRCTNTGNVGNVPATPWWDAYDALKAMGWKSRYVWTVTDTDGDGKLTANDTMLQLQTATNTAADTLIPYMALGFASGGICDSIADKINTAGDPVTAELVRSGTPGCTGTTCKRECAKAIIRWILGADVFNEAGRSTTSTPLPWPPLPQTQTIPASTSNPPLEENLPDRPFKLGDIYHSSPVVVDAPLPSDGILCPNGLSNQCLQSLWQTTTPHTSGNQYDAYSKSGAYQYRRKMVLVGANDGLFHAFNGGAWHAGVDDPVTAGIDESKPPFNGYYDRGEQDGPQELWAFLPPDLLGKIPLTVAATADHHLYVDGTAMVRDIWVDSGTDHNLLVGGCQRDGKKQAGEFHTVAVVGERRGGTHYFALDVTDAAYLPAESNGVGPLFGHAPQFLWVYPQPNDPESFRFGETYDDFLPVPPPIGPVRIRADGSPGSNAQNFGLADATNAQSFNGTSVKFNELWVTMLPSGYDPSYLRGRGVHMVDVWRGNSIWDFTFPTSSNPASPAGTALVDPRSYLQYPVIGTPAMVMWGSAARRPSLGFENNGFFDTATFGDAGGQLWVLRFNKPGEMDNTGKITNWWGGRIFVQGKGTTGASLCPGDAGLPFSFITANTALPGTHVYRVYAGTGDRPNLLDQNGGVCAPTNLRACAQKGCSVSLAFPNNYETETSLGYDSQGLTQPVCPTGSAPSATLLSRSANTGTAPTCGATAAVQAAVGVTTVCPDVASGAGTFTKDVAMVCTPDAAGNDVCHVTKASDNTALSASYGAAVAQNPNLTRNLSLNWFFSLKVFEDTGARTIFGNGATTANDKDAAANYDQAALQFRDLVSSVDPVSQTPTPTVTAGVASNGIVVIDGANNAPTVLADSNSAGWAIFYNHTASGQITTNGHTYTVNPLDERTSSVTAIYGKVFWNALQPALSDATSAVSGCAASKCTATSYRLAYHYAADAVTGGTVITDPSNANAFTRALVQNTLVPAQGDQPTVFVNQKGQIAVGLTSVNPEKGASNVGMSAAMDPVMGLGMTEVSRALHNCRHAASTPAASACK